MRTNSRPCTRDPARQGRSTRVLARGTPSRQRSGSLRFPRGIALALGRLRRCVRRSAGASSGRRTRRPSRAKRGGAREVEGSTRFGLSWNARSGEGGAAGLGSSPVGDRARLPERGRRSSITLRINTAAPTPRFRNGRKCREYIPILYSAVQTRPLRIRPDAPFGIGDPSAAAARRTVRSIEARDASSPGVGRPIRRGRALRRKNAVVESLQQELVDFGRCRTLSSRKAARGHEGTSGRVQIHRCWSGFSSLVGSGEAAGKVPSGRRPRREPRRPARETSSHAGAGGNPFRQSASGHAAPTPRGVDITTEGAGRCFFSAAPRRSTPATLIRPALRWAGNGRYRPIRTSDSNPRYSGLPASAADLDGTSRAMTGVSPVGALRAAGAHFLTTVPVRGDAHTPRRARSGGARLGKVFSGDRDRAFLRGARAGDGVICGFAAAEPGPLPWVVGRWNTALPEDGVARTSPARVDQLLGPSGL